MAAGLATYWGDETWYRRVVMPIAQLFGAENAHWLAVKAAKHKLVPAAKPDYPSMVCIPVFV